MPPACAYCAGRPRLLGYQPSFSIYDQADAVRLTGYVVRELGLDMKKFPARAVHAAISGAKNELLGAAAYAERARRSSIFERKIAEVYQEYQRRLRGGQRHGLRRPARRSPSGCSGSTPKCSPPIRSASRTYWWTSTRTPTGRRTSSSSSWPAPTTTSPWWAIPTSRSTGGGAPTSGTSWSSSAPSPTPRVVVLDQNYRSTQTILDAANAVIANNLSRKPKDLWTSQGGGEQLVRFVAEDEHDEGAWLASEVVQVAAGAGLPLGRRRRLLPDQRPEPGHRGRAGAPGASPTRSSGAPGSTSAGR